MYLLRRQLHGSAAAAAASGATPSIRVSARQRKQVLRARQPAAPAVRQQVTADTRALLALHMPPIDPRALAPRFEPAVATAGTDERLLDVRGGGGGGSGRGRCWGPEGLD